MRTSNWKNCQAFGHSGDRALIPDIRTGQFHPPTAQHASREGKSPRETSSRACVAGKRKPFDFRIIGLLAAIGRRTGVARIFGINFSGFLAWFLWRGIYWNSSASREEIRVAIDWASMSSLKDFVQYLDQRSQVISVAGVDAASVPTSQDRRSRRQRLRKELQLAATNKHDSRHTAEHARLEDDASRKKHWKRWGPISPSATMGVTVPPGGSTRPMDGLFPARSRPEPCLSLGRGRIVRHNPSPVPALFRPRLVERPRPDSKGAALWPHGLGR